MFPINPRIVENVYGPVTGHKGRGRGGDKVDSEEDSKREKKKMGGEIGNFA